MVQPLVVQSGIGPRDRRPPSQPPARSPPLRSDLGRALGKEEAEFGADILRRSAVGMTLRESRSSFQINGEQDQATRVQRFAAVMETRTGQGNAPLTDEAMATLQKEILGEVTTLSSYGLRQSPVFVGQAVRYENVVHYVAPEYHSGGARAVRFHLQAQLEQSTSRHIWRTMKG